MPYSPVGGIAEDIAADVNASRRQLDYWARHGLFGDERDWKAGTGSKRPWHMPHVRETAYACARLSELGAPVAVMQPAARVVRARPVMDSEWLIVTADGAMRLDHHRLDERALRIPAYVIPLRSFAAAVPTQDGSDLPTDPGAAGAEDGRHRSAAVPATHF